MNKRRILIGGSCLVLIGFILYQGTRNLDQSLAYSDQIVNRVMSWWLDDPTLSSEAYFKWYPTFNYLIRKLAHFAEYAMLGWISVWYFARRKTSKMDIGVYAFLVVLILAVIDEFLQKYSGRGSLVSDVVIDAIGGWIGIQLALIIRWLFNRPPFEVARRQWTGQQLAELIRWSERHVFTEEKDGAYQVALITPDGTRWMNSGDWVVRLNNGTYTLETNDMCKG